MNDKVLDSFRSWIKNNKRIAVIVAVGILGILLIFFSGFDSETKKEKAQSPVTQESYEQETEQKLKRLIESIDGAGMAEIMITFESSGESVFARDMSENVENAEKDESKRTEDKYVIVENDGDEGGLLTKAVYPRVRGVAVCCDGASDSVIRQRITETVSALFDINSKNISVVRRAG